MLRLVLVLVLAACGNKTEPVYPIEGEQPLPPASGTAIGYLLDNGGQLELTAEQREKLQQIDTSLSARNEAIDTQLREIEKPLPEEPPDKNAPPGPPPNMAPGATPVHTTKDSAKLHEQRAANNKEALEKAFALLQRSQQEAAKKLLDARGIASPKLAPPPAPEPGPAPEPAPAPAP